MSCPPPGSGDFPDRLKTLRALRDVKQITLARWVGVHEITVSRWERGKTRPTLRQQVAICEALGTSREELGLADSRSSASPVSAQGTGSSIDAAAHRPDASVGVIPPVPAGEAPYYVWDMNRREFVRVAGMGLLLSAFPSAPLRLWESLPSTGSDGCPITIETLDSYWQVLDLGWTLCNNGQLAVVDGMIQSYLPHVLGRASDRPAAAALAAQSLRLLSVVRTHELRIHEKIALNQQAVEYARQASDATVLAAALTELAVAFKYADQPYNSVAAYDEALNHAHKAEPLVRSRVYAGTAAAYAQRSLPKEARKYMTLAHQAFPASPQSEPNRLMADFGVWLLAFYEGLTHMLGQDPVNARTAFTSYEEHPTAGLTPERNRLEILNQQARVAVLEGDPDAFADHLESSVVRAVAINSRKRLDEAIAIYRDETPANWVDQPRVVQLADLIEQRAS